MVRAFSVTFSPVSPSPRVAACTSAPALIAQRQRQPVDLRLGGEGQRRVGGQVQDSVRTRSSKSATPRPSKAFSRLSMRTGWRTLAKPSARRRRRPGRDGLSARFSAGKARLDRGIAALQRVIVGIRDLGRVLRCDRPGSPPRCAAARRASSAARLALRSAPRPACLDGHGPPPPFARPKVRRRAAGQRSSRSGRRRRRRAFGRCRRRIAQHIAAAPDRLDVVLARRWPRPVSCAACR